jgi:hypothetical protein
MKGPEMSDGILPAELSSISVLRKALGELFNKGVISIVRLLASNIESGIASIKITGVWILSIRGAVMA